MQNFKSCITEVSIDRLTVVGYIIKNEEFQKNIINDYSITQKLLNYSKVMGYSQSLQLVEGLGHIDIDPRENIIRYEFNPNKFTEENKVNCGIIINHLKNISFSRLDIAVDMNIDFNTYDFRCTRDVKHQYYTSTTKKIETIYFGAFKSDVLYRLYNKTVERQEKGAESRPNWWRLEVQLNAKRKVEDFLYSEYTPFYDIVVGNSKGFNESFRFKCKNMKDFLFFKEVYLNRNYLDELSRREKESFNKMKKEYEEVLLKDYLVLGNIVKDRLDDIKTGLQELINEHNVFKINF